MSEKAEAGGVPLSKDARIKREIKRLRAVFKDLDKNKLKVVEKLIETAAFIAISLQDLEADINLKGYVSEYQNGENQFGTKKSPEVEIHLSMTKNFTVIMKQLAELAPPERKKKSGLEALKEEG